MRVIFCLQASKTKQHQNKIKPNLGQWLTEITKLTALSLTLMGVGFFQQTAQAETARIDDITIDRQPDETYDSLIQRAETAARTALLQGFNRTQVTNVSVVILGQNQGVIAPVLAIGLSRPQWRGGSNKFTYFNSARSLLRLEEPLAVGSTEEGEITPSPPASSAPGRRRNNPAGSAREIINNAPVRPVNPFPGATPLPGSPALVPRPQSPGITPVTSPGDNFNAAPSSGTPVTTPTPQNLPQVNPANNTPNQR